MSKAIRWTYKDTSIVKAALTFYLEYHFEDELGISEAQREHTIALVEKFDTAKQAERQSRAKSRKA